MSKKQPKVERPRIAVHVENGRLSALDAFGQEQIDKLDERVIGIARDMKVGIEDIKKAALMKRQVVYDDKGEPVGTEPVEEIRPQLKLIKR